jgi:hypothetical protein
MKLRNRLRAAINSAIINRKAGKPVLSGSWSGIAESR